MKQIGRRIYFDVSTGNVIMDKGEMNGDVVETTVEEDILIYSVLIERNRDSFDFIELEYGQFAQDFAQCNGFRVNLATKELEFSYPDQNEPEAPQIFRRPLSQEVEELKIEQAETNTNLLELMEIVLLGGI